MPNLATIQNTTVAEKIYNTVKDNDWYSQDSYNAMVEQTGSADNYLGLMYSLKDKDLSQYEMNLDDYKYLNGEQKIQYLDFYINKDHNSDEFKQYQAYIYEQITLAKDQETYENLSGIGKAVASIAGFAGKLLEGVLKGVEGIIDFAAMTSWVGLAELISGQDLGVKSFIGKDLVGKDLLNYSNALDSFNRKYTIMDKGWIGETLSSVAEGLGQLIIAAIPGVGQAAYFGSIIGNSIEEAIQTNPDVSLGSAMLYGATIGGVEYGIERLSMGIFGKTGVDKLIFKNSATVAGKTTGAFYKRLGSDMWKEGVEEMASEIAGDAAYFTFVSQDHDLLVQQGKSLATGQGWLNVLTAGLVGGIIGGSVTSLQIGATRRAYITSNGELITYNKDGYAEIVSQFKEGKSNVKQLSKTQTYALPEFIANLSNTHGQENVTKLQAKYGVSVEQLQNEHADEYNEAAKQDSDIRKKTLDNAMWLSNIINGVGEKQFEEGLKLYQTVADKKFELLQNWAKRQELGEQNSVEVQKLKDKFQTQHKGISINVHENDLNSNEINIQKAMAKLGKKVYFVDFGSENGDFYGSEIIDEDNIFIQKDLQNVWSLERIQKDAVKHELAHSLQMFFGTLSPKLMLRLKKLMMEKVSANTLPAELDRAYANEKTNIKISEAQANILAEMLIDDSFTINALFLGEYPVFKGIFGWFAKKRYDAKKKKGEEGKIEYNVINTTMLLYKAAIESNIENREDIDEVIQALSIDETEAEELINTYLPDEYYGNFTILKDQFSTHGQARVTAEKILKTNRKDKKGKFNYTRAFEIDYYANDFVNKIMAQDPSKSFKYNLQTWLRTQTNFMISQTNGCLVETVDLSTEFKDDVLNFNSTEDFANKVKTVKDLFKNEELIKAFQVSKNDNSLENIKVEIKPARSSKLCDMVYEGGAEPKIVVHTRPDVDFTNELTRNTFLGEFMGQVTVAMADAQGLAIGTSPDVVAMSLAESVSDNDVDFLAKQLFTKEYYNQVKGNKAEMIDSLSYAIYRSTDGAVLKADKKFKKAGGATPRYNTNANGFVNIYGGIHGYGIFKDIFIPQPVSVYDALSTKQEQIKETKQADLVTLSKKESMKDFYKFTSQFTAEELVKMGVDHVIAEDIVTQQATKTDLDYAIAEDKITSDEIINAYINTYYRNNENIKSYADAKQALNILEKTEFKEETEPVQAILAEKDDSFWIQFFIENDINPNDSAVSKKLRKKLNSLETSSAEKQISISTKDEAEESTNEKTSIESLQDTRSTGSEIVDDALGITETSTRQEHTKESVKTYTEKFFDSQAVLKQVKDMRAVYLLAKGDVNKIQAMLEKRPKDYAELQKMLNEMNLTFEQYVKGTIGKKANIYAARLVYDLKDRVKTPDEIDYLIKNFFTSNTRRFYMDLKTIFSNDDFATIRKALVELRNQKFPEKSEKAVKSTKKTPVKSATTAKTEVSDEQKVVPKKAEKQEQTKTYVNEKTGQTSFLEPVEKSKAVKKATSVKKEEPKVITKEEPKPVEKEPEQQTKKVEDMTPEEVVEATPAQKEVDEIAAQIESLREQIAAMRKEIPKERVKCMWIDTIDNRNDGMIDGTTISFEGECYDKSTTKGLRHSSIKKLVLYDSVSGKKTEVGRYENGKWIVKPDPTYNVYISFIAASRRMLDEEYATDKSDMSKPLQNVMNTKATRIIQNQVKNMSNVDRVHQIANLKDFIQANWGYINKFTIDDFKEIVKKCLDPTRAFTGAEQNNILMLAMVLKEKQGVLVEQDEKFKELFVKLDEYLNKRLSLSGQQLSLWSRMVKEANPLMGLEREFFETFGKELKIDDELKKKYKSAIREHKFDKGEDSIAAIEKEIMEKTTEQIPEDRFKVFEHGISKDVRWQRFKNLLGTFTAFRYMAMLSNPATHMVNFVSNLGIQLMDGAAYRIMNWFSAGLNDIDGQYEYRKGALNKETVDKINERFGGLLDSIAETGKYDETGTSNLFRQATKKKVYNSKVMQACNNLIFGLLQRFDKRFVRPALAKELARLVDSNNIDLDNITPQELDKLLDNVTRRVLHSYLRDDSKASLFIENVCANHPLIGFFIKAVIPFPRVTINITRRVLEYSPVGLINGIFRWVRARKAKKSGLKHGTVLDDQFYVADTKITMARATVGTSLLIIGCILAALDILGFDDDDENNGIVLKIGDYKLSLSNIAPAATPLLLGAALKHAEDKNLTDRLLKVMNDATVLGTFNDLFVHRSNLAEYITVPASTYATQFMPAILRSIAKGIDPTKKQIEYDYNTVPGWFNTTFQRIISGLPLGRQLLPNKVDPYTGKPALEYNSAVLPWINIFMPAKISKDTDTDLSSELKSIGAATTGASGKNMSINGQALNLKGHDLSTFRKNRGENVNKLLNDLVNNKKKYRVQKEDGTYEELYYSNMTDKQKKNAATNLYDKATDYAKIQYWISNGHKYYTSNRDEYNTLRKAIGAQGIVYRANWNKSKYVN